jgi:hypothetical protein
MRKIFGPEREEAAEHWRKIPKEGLRVFIPPIIFRVFRSKKNEMAEASGTYGGDQKYIPSFS